MLASISNNSLEFFTDLQVTIHEGLVEVQDDLLEVIANFTDNSHITITTLSAPQVHALLDHMCARCMSSHSFLSAVKHSTSLESFLKNGPSKLFQSFFARLPDIKLTWKEVLPCSTDLETEVSHFSKVL